MINYNLDINEEDEDNQKDKYLIFSIDNESYGIDIALICEIIGIQPITDVPGLPTYIKGIINLRGKVIPLMDIRLRLKKVERPYTDRTCIIVIEINNLYIGLIVDRVEEVLIILEENISAYPNINSSMPNKYIKSIANISNNIKLLIDCKMLFNDAEYFENL